ncbi:MAG: thioredoxin domain-containing protein [Desulfomonile sp.]|nr:thioredoxin domain-containing protein [Desulfomonile sp.]
MNPIIRWWRNRAKPISPELIPKDRPYFCGALPFAVILAVALLGTFASGFLAYRHVLLLTETAAVGQSPLCQADGVIDCDAVLLTEYAVLFDHVGSAVLGLMGFVFVLWATVNAILNQRLRKLAWVTLLLYFFAAIGFSWYFLYVMIYKVDHICPWCLVVHAVNALSLVVMIVGSVRRKQEFLWPEIASLGERIYFVAGGVLLSLLVFFAAGMAEKSLALAKSKEKYQELAENPAVILSLLKAAPAAEIPVSENDPTFGTASAPHTLVLFSDFACPVCPQAKNWLLALVARNPGVLRLVYKHYPLSTDCNKGLVSDLHPKGCQAAVAAQAAFVLGGNDLFWAYGNLLFANQGEFARAPWLALAQRLRLDPDQFRALLQEGSPADLRVRQDIALGLSLGLNGTPQIFFDGKRLPADAKPDLLVRAMEELVRVEHPEKRDFALNRP